MKGKKTKERLVIVGNGMAGTACLDEILKLDRERFEITVFGAEHTSYNRVMLQHLLTGEKRLEDISLHGPDWYERNGIVLHAGRGVTEVKRKKRVVAAEGGIEASYDRLILSTGAVPLMPPVPGIEKEGVVTFRDLKDCERIKSLSKTGARAVVVGGGLLGLEAAWGLKSLGMDVTIAHLMDRLMERQLDGASAAFLKHDIERLGIKVLLGREATCFTGEGRVDGVEFKDGQAVGADIVVVSAGIRPNAALARSSGIYCEKGIVVGDTMQTLTDPAVYAIGECIQHKNQTFGLVAPIFDQARVLADHLAGTSRLTFSPKPTSARLKIPGIELYSAGESDGHGKESIEYVDKTLRVYKRLIINEGRLKGIIMYGDTSDATRLFSLLTEGADISDKRRSLLLASVPDAAPSIRELPDDAIVCGCNGVTKKMIVDAIVQKGLFTREDVKRETKASGSCGGCARLVDSILESTLGASFQAARDSSICPCTQYSRDDVIKNISEKGLKSVSEVMDTLGWETVGCETCRPALNYYVSMIWPEDAEDDLTSRVVNERTHANIQKDRTFSVVPRIYGGAVRPDELRKIADAADKYEVPLVKITGGQRIALLGVKKEDLKDIWKDLGMPSGFAYGKALRTVKSCVGSSYCRYGTQDSLSLAIGLEKRFEGLWTPAKVKLGVSACPRNCSEPMIKDIGVIGVAGGWEVYAGGSGGIELKGAEKIATVKDPEEVAEICAALLQHYRENGVYGERMFKWIARAGFKEIRHAVVDDREKRAELAARLNTVLEGAVDPWKEKVAENERHDRRELLH